jgi:hypothetical protein
MKKRPCCVGPLVIASALATLPAAAQVSETDMIGLADAIPLMEPGR